MNRRRFLLATAGSSFALAGCSELSNLWGTPHRVEEMEFRRVDDIDALHLLEEEDGSYPPEGFEAAEVEGEERPILVVQGIARGGSWDCYTTELENTSYRDGVFSFTVDHVDDSERSQDCPDVEEGHPYEIYLVFENSHIPDEVNGQHGESFENTVEL